MGKNVLLISEDYVKTYSNLNQNTYGELLLPSIKTAQEIGLQSILGSCLYNALLDMVDDGSITATTNTAYKALLDEAVQPFLLWQTITDIVPMIGVKLANIGVITQSDEHINSLSESDRANIKQFYQYKADFYCKQLQHFILDNKAAYKELDECQCEKIKSNLNSAASIGIWLGGYRGQIIRDNNCC